jgi:CubicO group peptidase (beta-lactamase class C family)
MFSSRRRLLSALLLGVSLAITTSASGKITDHPDVSGSLALLDRWIEAHQIYERVPGISVGVVLDQNLIWHKGYGYANVRRRTHATEETLYSICSISKLFTSVALMQQRDAGKLQLDDPVSRHLDWFQIEQAHPDSGPITVRSLMTHSSGLPRESVNHYWNPDYPFPAREQLIEGLKSQETLYPAGTFHQYSNLALTLVGEIAAARAGKPYAELVQQDILDPLGLSSTHPYFPEDEHGKALAYGYGALDREGKRQRVPAFDTSGITPAAGFTSNVVDLSRFASWQFRLLASGGEEVLRASTLKEMQRVQWTDPDWKTTWGLGFNVSKVGQDTSVGHGGGCPGFTTAFAMIPEHKMAVIALTNAGGTEPFRIVANTFKALGPALQKAAEGEPAEEIADFSDYAGLYHAQPWSSEIAIVQIADKLIVASLPSNDPTENQQKLEQVDGDRFRRVRDNDEGTGEDWQFERDPSGKVVSVTRHGFRLQKAD